MAHDNLTDCSRCGSNACYTQQVNKEITISLCYGCGFQSNTIMTVGSDMFNEQIETLPELYKILMDEEDNGKLWMPSFHNVPGKGMVFIDGKTVKDWKWSAVKATELSEEELKSGRYPKGQTHKMDMATAKIFEQKGFMDALEVIGFFNIQ